jgi:hypothetical protein
MKLTTLTLWRIVGPAGPVGAPGAAGPISDECTRLNDEANPDPERMRQTPYTVERAV